MLLQLTMRSNEPLPEKIANAPQLLFGSDFFYEIFIDLCSDRTSDNGALLPIAFMTIVEYCSFYEFDRELAQDVVRYVRALDEAYCDWANKKTVEKMGKK